jgi:aminocarboxymuconate-semialdehyde decarboxylase
MLFQCKVSGPATDHGSAPLRPGKPTKPWRTIDIATACMALVAGGNAERLLGIPAKARSKA